MASKNVNLSATEYTKLDTSTASAILVQNVGDAAARIIFASSTPGVNDLGYFVLQPGQGIPRDQMTGDIYARAASAGLARVTVGE